MAIRHATRAGRAGAGDLQRQRLDHPARVRRRRLHLCRAGDRGRLDQGVPHPGRRRAPGRALPRAGARHQVGRRDRRARRASWPQMPEKVDRVLDTIEPVRALARDAGRRHRRCCSSAGTSGYPVALEGALKLKELAYMHAEGFPAGELKHGPIALIEEGLPVVVIVPSPRCAQGAARQDREQHPGGPRPRRAHDRDRRGGRRDGRAVRRHAHPHPAVPTLLQPLVATVPLQVFACELASAKGYDVDQPRNLAKSVTVE